MVKIDPYCLGKKFGLNIQFRQYVMVVFLQITEKECVKEKCSLLKMKISGKLRDNLATVQDNIV